MFVFIFYRYSNTACELLTSDVSQINDALADSEELVKKLYAFLEMEKPLNPLLASFFSKVMGLLITRKSEMVRISNKMRYVIFYKKNPTFTNQLNTQKVLHLIGNRNSVKISLFFYFVHSLTNSLYVIQWEKKSFLYQFLHSLIP